MPQLFFSTLLLSLFMLCLSLQCFRFQFIGLPAASLPLAMTHLWSLDDFKQELTHLSELYDRRPGSQVCQTMLNQFCQKASALQTWTSNGILQLLSHVEDLLLPEPEKERLNQCLESLSLSSGEAVKVVKAGQVLHNLPAYLNQDDWTKLNAKSTVTDHLEVVSKRLAAMGVTSCRENTKHQAVSLVLKMQTDQGKPEPSPQTIKTYCHDFKVLHEEHIQGVTPGPRTYPSRPADMGINWLDKAYGQLHPLGLQVSLGPWMAKVALRKTNKLLQEPAANEEDSTFDKVAGYLNKLLAKHPAVNQPQVVFTTPAVASTMPQPTAPVNVTAGPAQEPQLPPVAQVVQVPNSHVPLPHSEVPPVGQHKEEPLPLPDCQSNQSKQKSLQQMEEEAFQKLQKKKPALKRPAAATQPKASTKASAKAKAASKGPKVMKKPVAKLQAGAKSKPASTTRTGLTKGPGCCKCRGQGCSTCGSPTFKGTVIPGPEAYKAWIGRA